MLPSRYWRRTVAFLREIGLVIILRPGATGFLPYIRIVDGQLHVDLQCPISNLLHEAGHLATVPERYRPAMSDNLANGHKLMLADINRQDLEPDDPLWRAALQASDPEATAWAWAVGKHLNVPAELVIHDAEYDGTGADVRLALELGSYAGIHGLAHAGFCVTRPQLTVLVNRPAYPQLGWWLQRA